MYPRILASILQANQRSVLVLGPRQVGKSTLLASTAPDISLNLASPRVFRDFVGYPERFERELLAASPCTRTVFVDEVQRVPALLDVVQLFLDEHPGRFRFLLSGSSARKLRRGQANLLPGRIHVHQMHPLLACELAEDFDLDRALAHGTLPGIYAERDSALRAVDLRSYADTYLREEIQAEALVRNLGGFSRLLDLMAASSGRILNVQALCKQAGLGYETARRYIEVLEDTLIMFRGPGMEWLQPCERCRASPALPVRHRSAKRPSEEAARRTRSPTNGGSCWSISSPANCTAACGRSGRRPRSSTTGPGPAPRSTSCWRWGATSGESRSRRGIA